MLVVGLPPPRAHSLPPPPQRAPPRAPRHQLGTSALLPCLPSRSPSLIPCRFSRCALLLVTSARLAVWDNTKDAALDATQHLDHQSTTAPLWPERKPGASLYTRERPSLFHGGQGERLVPWYTRGRVPSSITGGRVKAWWLLLIHPRRLYLARPSPPPLACSTDNRRAYRGGQEARRLSWFKALVSQHAASSIAIYRGLETMQVTTLGGTAQAGHGRYCSPRHPTRFEPTGPTAKAWCLRIHAEASFSRSLSISPPLSLTYCEPSSVEMIGTLLPGDWRVISACPWA